MLDLCQQAIAVVDASKWGQLGIASFAAIAELDIITDHAAPEDDVRAVLGSGADV